MLASIIRVVFSLYFKKENTLIVLTLKSWITWKPQHKSSTHIEYNTFLTKKPMPTDSEKCPCIYFLIKVFMKYSYKQETMNIIEIKTFS